MKNLNLRVLGKLLKGLFEGTLVLQAVPTGKKPGKKIALKKVKSGNSAKKKGPVGKRGRKPLSAAEKRNRLKERARLERLQKSNIPTPRQILEFLYDRIDGAKLTAIAKHFSIKRTLIKDMVERLAKNGDLENMRGTYFLQKRMRKMGKKPPKPAPITEKQVINYLLKHPNAKLAGMASDMGEKYQRLIKVIKGLEKDEKIVKSGKEYSLV